MSIQEQIVSFPQQFLWKPEIEHNRLPSVKHLKNIVICGMGGSALAGAIFQTWREKNKITLHRDFGIPEGQFDLIIAISYSGNTEETISCLHTALKKRVPSIGIASGGAIEQLCHDHNIPFIKLPSGFEPRQALGLMLKALVTLLSPRHTHEVEHMTKVITPSTGNSQGKKLSKNIFGKIPLIYSSQRLIPLAYNWKIRFNETAKIPAFTGVMPELFHNEITGFDVGPKLKRSFRDRFIFLVLADPQDPSEIKKRINNFTRVMAKKNYMVEIIRLRNVEFLELFFTSVMHANWTAYHLARQSGADPEHVPMVEEFKKINREKSDSH